MLFCCLKLDQGRICYSENARFILISQTTFFFFFFFFLTTCYYKYKVITYSPLCQRSQIEGFQSVAVWKNIHLIYQTWTLFIRTIYRISNSESEYFPNYSVTLVRKALVIFGYQSFSEKFCKLLVKLV